MDSALPVTAIPKPDGELLTFSLNASIVGGKAYNFGVDDPLPVFDSHTFTLVSEKVHVPGVFLRLTQNASAQLSLYQPPSFL